MNHTFLPSNAYIQGKPPRYSSNATNSYRNERTISHNQKTNYNLVQPSSFYQKENSKNLISSSSNNNIASFQSEKDNKQNIGKNGKSQSFLLSTSMVNGFQENKKSKFRQDKLNVSNCDLSSSSHSKISNKPNRAQNLNVSQSEFIQQLKNYKKIQKGNTFAAKMQLNNQINSKKVTEATALSTFRRKKSNSKCELSKHTVAFRQNKESDKFTSTGEGYFRPRFVCEEKKSKQQQHISELKLSDFLIGPCKGEGKFGKVYLAVHKKTRFICALKKIRKESVKYMMEQFIQQIKIQLYLNHPKIVKAYGYFADKDYFYMAIEYMEEGCLYALMKKNRNMEVAEVKEKIYEISQGIKEMHDNDIVHRDLKPQNVVMSYGVSKICDFGWAAICTDRRNTYCGTLDYVSPQIIQGMEYDNSVDVWCLGVLVYEMLCGKAPFYDISRQKTMQKIKSCRINNYPAYLPQSAVSFIEMALQRDPSKRVGIKQLLESDFLKAMQK